MAGCACEVLEARRMLAGNVSAVISDGDLYIRGDPEDNSLSIDTQNLPAGQVRLWGSTTFVNGKTAIPVVVTGFTRNVHVYLGKGNDGFTVNASTLPGDVEIIAGMDDDTILVDQTDIAGSLLIRGREGADSLHVTGSSTAAGLSVFAGRGPDVLSATGNTIGGDLELHGLRGHDSISYCGNAIHGATRIDGGPGENLISENTVGLSYDFSAGDQGWTADFANYFVDSNNPNQFQLESGIRPLPPSTSASGNGFYLSGQNDSASLDMYLKKSVGAAQGLVAGQKYQVLYSIDFASNAVSGQAGLGATPDSVGLFAGAGNTEPKTVPGSTDPVPHYNLNLAPTGYGSDATFVAAIGNGLLPSDNPQGGDADYRSINRGSVKTAVTTADANGQLWLFVGTSSGYDGTTGVYYERINVSFIPIR